MKYVFDIHKSVGSTPLETINSFKEKFPEYKDKKIAYAGRLDPMAEGLLLLLVEPETKNRDKYQKLDKVYEFEILFGVETDTYDALGKIPNSTIQSTNKFHNTKYKVQIELEKLVGKKTQPFPPYSSARVKGKPLFWWARNNKLEEIKIPSKEIEIYSTEFLSIKSVTAKKLLQEIIRKINLVKGDFRQKEIIKGWKEFFEQNKDQNFTIAKCKIHCSSGTYVRSIAHDIGKKLGIGAIAFSIKRTKVGKHSIKDSLRLE